MMVFGIRNQIGAMRSAAWPTVDAMIVSSTIRTAATSKRTDCFPDIWYAYVIDGRRFEGSRITDTIASSNSIDEERRAIAPYPQGLKMRIHYNPSDPATQRIARFATDLETGMAC
jgi:hypothetical protein